VNKQHLFTGSFASLGIVCLILDGKTALLGAQTGIDLCIRTVIPSLFPFFLLSVLLTNTLSGSTFPILKPIGRILQIPEGCESILLIGLLGGYPTGAQSISSAYHAGQLNKEYADRMLSFCNNAGPAFLFGMIAPMFSSRITSVILWGIHIASALYVGMIVRGHNPAPVKFQPEKNTSISSAMRTSITAMATVCGWVILFRIVLSFLEHWFLWMLPTPVQVLMGGILELSNGCCDLGKIQNPELRFVLCSGMLAWGGLCVVMQTHSVTDGLSIGFYLRGKLLQTFFSLILSIAVVLEICFPVVTLMLIFALLIKKQKNSGGNPASIGV